ncbi:MAG TPA: hypothetical protein VF414_07480 [Thermoanaerobaculia bacterium]
MHPRFLSLVVFCLLMSIPALAAAPAAAQEIHVNSSTVGWQKCPAVVAGPAGDYMVVFASEIIGPGEGPEGVLAQRIGPAGERIGPELSLDLAHPTPCLTAARSGPGRFLVVWGVQVDIGRHAIYARHFDFQGNPQGPKFQAGEGSAYVPPGAACDPEGHCWIAWVTEGVEEVRMRRFALSGEPLGEEIRVDAPGTPERWELQVSGDSQGGFTIAWWRGDTSTGVPEDPPAPLNGEIRVRRFSAAGEPLVDEFPVATDPAYAYYSPVICQAEDGSFAVAGNRLRKDTRSGGVFLRRFSASGTPAGPESAVVEIDESSAPVELACGADGSVLLFWLQGNGIDPPLLGRFFGPAGNPTGAPFLVSGSGGSASAALAGPGRFLVAWERYATGPGFEVLGRVYDIHQPELQLPLHQGRFRIEATFRDPHTGQLGQAHVVPLTDETGLLWFFSSSNIELVVKLLDGCGVNGHYWFFAGGLTDVEVEITVIDSDGSFKQYRNPPGTAFLPIQDTRALACD